MLLWLGGSPAGEIAAAGRRTFLLTDASARRAELFPSPFLSTRPHTYAYVFRSSQIWQQGRKLLGSAARVAQCWRAALVKEGHEGAAPSRINLKAQSGVYHGICRATPRGVLSGSKSAGGQAEGSRDRLSRTQRFRWVIPPLGVRGSANRCAPMEQLVPAPEHIERFVGCINRDEKLPTPRGGYTCRGRAFLHCSSLAVGCPFCASCAQAGRRAARLTLPARRLTCLSVRSTPSRHSALSASVRAKRSCDP